MKFAVNSTLTKGISKWRQFGDKFNLVDSFGRRHDYLRFSLTERCNLRCRYCMPDNGVSLTPKQDCLTLDEARRLMDIFILRCGISKVRLTGGEPTLDTKLVPLLGYLSELRTKSNLKTVALTTNGMTLSKKSTVYRELGKKSLLMIYLQILI